ncbi:MAG: thrombospondin type 3 repeat-containing protein [Deltaproteobacteria bacterium]|nr:thrombospondin type 3 repeat-containing protein [Deltaproteobacteria bacterium]
MLHKIARTAPVVTLCSLLLVGCRFDGGKLEQRACPASGQCGEEGMVCCQGYCVLAASCPDAGPDAAAILDGRADLNVAADTDLDGVLNDKDNCPSAYNPGQQDQDFDGLGDACDCDPTDKRFTSITVDLPSFPQAVPFTPVESPANWQLVGRAYKQASKNGVQRAAHALEDQTAYQATVRLSFLEAGDDGLTVPANGVSLAGVVVRTSGLGPGTGSGYYCAIDLKNFRLVIGKTKADELGKGQLPLFAEPASEPGKPITRGVKVNIPYSLTLRARDGQLTCRVTSPDLSQVETTAADSEFTRGGLAIFTAGASAIFESVKVCTSK